MKTVAVWVGGVMIVAATIGAFVAYACFTLNTRTGELYDGFGRQLSEAPLLLKLLGKRAWAGLFWMMVDLVLFWSGIIAGSGLVYWGLIPADKK